MRSWRLLFSGRGRRLPPGPLRLHVGSGRKRLDGWVNIDIEPLPGVDVVLDVTRRLDFENAEAIFCEHFLEHLTLEQAASFLILANRALAADGRLRVTTPSLDYVLATQYRPSTDPQTAVHSALRINGAFHAWGHQFLWNAAILERVLLACGFRDLEWQRRGESRFKLFRGLERHEVYPDTEDLPHVLVVEASKGDLDADRVAKTQEMLALWRVLFS